MAASQNLRTQALGAGPRAVVPRQLTLLVVHAVALDTAGSVHDTARDRDPWPDNAGSPANAATAGPLADTLDCNNAFADAATRTAAGNS
jgi:hypothetical protein